MALCSRFLSCGSIRASSGDIMCFTIDLPVNLVTHLLLPPSSCGQVVKGRVKNESSALWRINLKFPRMQLQCVPLWRVMA